MMTEPRVNLQDARKAKETAVKRYARMEWCRGIGVVRQQSGYAVRISVAASATSVASRLPTSINGVPLTALVMGKLRARE